MPDRRGEQLMANIELVKKIKDAITAKPELWNQHKWAVVSTDALGDKTLTEFDEGEGVELTCGTAMCIAGWACHLSGEKINWREGDFEPDDDGEKFVAHLLLSGKDIEGRAHELLDLEADNANLLFYTYDERIVMDRLDQIIERGEIYDPYRLEDEEVDEPW
jgi:hypothetical protein